jgi:hypothetical protein
LITKFGFEIVEQVLSDGLLVQLMVFSLFGYGLLWDLLDRLTLLFDISLSLFGHLFNVRLAFQFTFVCIRELLDLRALTLTYFLGYSLIDWSRILIWLLLYFR